MTATQQVQNPSDNKSVPKYRLFPSCRLTVYLLAMSGFACCGGGMNNIAFALTCMTDQQDTNSTHDYPAVCVARLSSNDSKTGYVSAYDWSAHVQGLLLSAGAWGAAFSTLFSWLPDLYGARFVFFASGVLNGAANLMSPLAARKVGAFVFVRLVQGMGVGLCWSVLGHVAALWGNRGEVGFIMALVTSGLNVGSIINVLTAGKMCESIGWQYIFYFWGCMALLWSFSWLLLYSDDVDSTLLPISHDERTFIRHGKTEHQRHKTIPWRSIFSSPYVWIIGYTALMGNMMVYFINFFLPTYLKTVLFLPSTLSGIFAAIPPLVQLVARASGGLIADRLSCVSLTWNVRFFTIICSLLPAVLLLAATAFDCTHMHTAIALISLSFFFQVRLHFYSILPFTSAIY